MAVAVALGAAVLGAVVVGSIVLWLPDVDPARFAPGPRRGPADVNAPIRTPVVPATGGLRPFVRARLDPAVATGLGLTVLLAILIAAGVGVGALFVMVQRDAGFARFDLGAARFGADHSTEASDAVLRAITTLGSTPMVTVLAITVAVATAAARRPAARAVAAYLAMVVVGQWALANAVKLLVGRDRPAVLPLAGFSGSSFPSGHATAVAAVLTAVVLVAGRGHSRRVKALFGAFAAGVACAVAASRVLLGVHWLTDVLAGLALGWGWFALCTAALGGRVTGLASSDRSRVGAI